MRLLIVGGDKVSFYLVKQLLMNRVDDVVPEITVIEQRPEVARRLADRMGVSVIVGDGTSRRVLEEAGCAEADMVIALTGQDENNLIVCQIAKFAFEVPSTLAKLNNPKNRAVFGLFGVDKLYSSTEILADVIGQEIEYGGMDIAWSVPGNSKFIVDFHLSRSSDAVGKSLIQYDFPSDSRVVLITRSDGEVVMPVGETVMRAGDHMLMVCDEADFAEVWMRLVRDDDDN